MIETLINSTALALFSGGVVMLTGRDWFGVIPICVGSGLEYFKYFGRLKNLW